MELSYRDLLARLTDLDWLSMPAPEGERAGCMSSYDRASKYQEETGLYERWGANEDGTGCIRTLPSGGIVAFECDGPGVIWRIWSALPERGHMRVYFDGEAAPRIDMPFLDWFEAQPGDIPPLNLPELAPNLSRGRNCFIPIPFQSGCRIELDAGWGMYYHFTYTRFPVGTRMPKYEDRLTRDGLIALAEADRALWDRGEVGPAPDMRTELTVEPGATATVFQLEGAGTVRELLFLDPGLSPDALRRLVLRCYWDGEQAPSVASPVGDFFGGGPGYARYRCLPMSMERGRFSCRFPMPFERGMRMELANCGAEPVSVAMAAAVDRTPDCAQGRMRFHAKWHRGFFGNLDRARFEEGGDRWPDWPLLLVQGAAGRFCGAHLHVLDRWAEPEPPSAEWWYGVWDRKSVDWWWGEGDEKFFVDGERFPSTFGTGSEDWIGYAWAAEPPFARFDSAFACMNAMPIDGNGHTSVSRFQIADSVPFRQGFEGFIEKYKADTWDGANSCLYAAVPYWYQQPGTADGYPAIDPAQLGGMN